MKLPHLVICASLAAACLHPFPAAGQTGGHIGPSNGAIAGGMAGIGAGIVGIVVAVAVVHGHHVLSGCVSQGPNGPELKTADAKTWSLEGASATIKPGQRVKLHGDWAKHKKTAAGADVFTVDKLVKDYGACNISPAAPPVPAM